MKLLNPKYQAFTFVETLISLSVIVTFLLLPTLAMKQWQANQEANRFFATFEKLYYNSQHSAILLRTNMSIFVRQADQQLEFEVSGPNYEKQKIILDVPDDIYLVSDAYIHFLMGNGYLSQQLYAFMFKDLRKNQTIVYQSQMGGSRLERKDQ